MDELLKIGRIIKQMLSCESLDSSNLV